MSERINFAFKVSNVRKTDLDRVFLDVSASIHRFIRKHDFLILSEVSYDISYWSLLGSIEFDKEKCNFPDKEIYALLEDFSYEVIFMVASKYDAILGAGWSSEKQGIELIESIKGFGPFIDIFGIKETDIESKIKNESEKLFLVRELLMRACMYAFKNDMMKYRYMGIYDQKGDLKYKELLTCIHLKNKHVEDVFYRFMYIDENTGNIDLEMFFMAIKEHRLQNPFLSMMSEKINAHHEDNVPISVNMYSENLIPENIELARKLWDKNIKIIEIVESSPILPDTIFNFKEMCAKNGMDFKFYIDDFGTGYANPLLLTHVRDAVDGIKIDKKILDTVIKENGSGMITDIIKWTQELGYEIVFEGVDSYEKLNWINNNFNDGIAFQGFLFEEKDGS